MDPISQATLGALAARSVVPRHFCAGARAPVLVVGAAAGALPDIDVLFSIGGDFYDSLITHRGITHSLFFAPVIGPLLGWLVHVWRNRRHPPEAAGAAGYWMLACAVALWSHPLLDVLTPYGTQLLLPFTDARFAVWAMPIIDPLYTGVLVLGVVLAAWLAQARAAALVSLCVSSLYLAYGWHLNGQARDYAATDLAAQGVPGAEVEAFPTVLQPYLRRVVGRTPERDYVGYLSMWDPCAVSWSSGERTRGDLIERFEARRDGGTFHWFTMGFTHYTLRDDPAGGQVLIASDLRYGTEPDPAVSVFSVSVPVLDGALSPQQAAGGRFRPNTDRVGDVLGAVYGACVAPAR